MDLLIFREHITLGGSTGISFRLGLHLGSTRVLSQKKTIPEQVNMTSIKEFNDEVKHSY